MYECRQLLDRQEDAAAADDGDAPYACNRLRIARINTNILALVPEAREMIKWSEVKRRGTKGRIETEVMRPIAVTRIVADIIL